MHPEAKRATVLALQTLHVALALPMFGLVSFLEDTGYFYATGAFLGMLAGVAGYIASQARPDSSDRIVKRSAWRSTLLFGVGLFGFAWLRMGRIVPVMWCYLGVTLALAAAEGLIRIEPSAPPQRRHEARHSPAAVAPRRTRFDMLLPVWAVNMVFGTALGWALTQVVTLSAENYRLWTGVRAFLCIVVPVVCVLPGFWHLTREHLVAGLAVLAVGTGFQVATGIGAARDFLRGPESRDIEVVDIEVKSVRARTSRYEVRHLVLADGERIRLPEHLSAARGPAHIVWLPGLERLLVFEQQSG